MIKKRGTNEFPLADAPNQIGMEVPKMAKTYVKPTHPLFNDLTDKTFGRYRVREYRGRGKNGKNFRWLAYCDPELGGCGTEKTVQGSTLTSGRVESCGCMRLEHVTKHGLYQHRVYGIWKQMMNRCHNPKNDAYHRYGARGIYVVPEWHDVKTFIDWCGDHPRGQETLERQNNDGPYSPDNCVWDSRLAQANNTRKVTKFTWDGRTQSLHKWAREFNLPVTTLFNRLHTLHWPIDRALTTPKKSGTIHDPTDDSSKN